MTDFSVMTAQLKTGASEIERCASALSSCQRRLDQVHVQLSGSLTPIKEAVRHSSWKIAGQSGTMQRSGQVLQQCAAEYDRAEKAAASGNSGTAWSDIIISTTPFKAAAVVTHNDNQNHFELDIKPGLDAAKKMINKMVISAAGPAGKVIDTMVEGGKGDAGKAAGNIVELAGGLIKNTKGSKIKWADWFGLTKNTKTPLEYATGKYGNFRSPSTVCKWISSFLKSGFDNYKEHGNFGTRFWGETITEGGASLLEGFAITMGTAAVFTACGVAAPSLVIAGAAAGLTVVADMGLDALVHCLTGSDVGWKELVSDFVCDTAENVSSWVKEKAKSVGDWVNKTGQDIQNAVTDGWNNVKNGFQNMFGSFCKWGRMSFGGS